MNVRHFVDTNVLLCAIEGPNSPHSAKSLAARELLRGRTLALSTQVLGEFF